MSTRRFLPLRAVEGLFNRVASVLLVGVMFLIVADVAGRYLFRRAVQGTMEITEFVMVGIVYFSLSYTQAVKGHIHVSLVTDRAGPRLRSLFEAITCGIGVIVAGLMCWQGALSALDAWEYNEVTFGLIPFPTLPAKAAIPLGCLVLTARFLADFVTALKGIAGEESA